MKIFKKFFYDLLFKRSEGCRLGSMSFCGCPKCLDMWRDMDSVI